MRKALFFIAAGVALTALSHREAAAAAYCAYESSGLGGGTAENCGFHTFEQCLENVRGMGGTCSRNPHEAALWGYPAARRPIVTERRRRYR
jgi:Protein of unknown function (DUF3551)